MMYKDAEVIDMEAHTMDSEVAMAMYDSSIGKANPCWEGYVQRGMKPGADGKPVPNCIPVAKSDSWIDSPFRLEK